MQRETEREKTKTPKLKWYARKLDVGEEKRQQNAIRNEKGTKYIQKIRAN